MSGLIGTILVLGVAAFIIWKRCDIYPPICGGTGDNRNPFDTTGKSLTQAQRDLASQDPIGGVVKQVQDRIFKIDTKGGNLTQAQRQLAGANFAKTLSQHGWRLSV